MADVEEKSADLQKWLKKISYYERDFKDWQSRVEIILKRYRGGPRTTSETNPANFNILWSNVQTAIPATFSRLPKPSVSRRFRDNDPVGRVASMIIERGIEFEIDHYPDFRAAMKNSVFDRFLGGRGIAWVRYEEHKHKKVAVPAEESDNEANDIAEEAQEPLDEVQSEAATGDSEGNVQITEDADEAEDTPAAQEEIDYECVAVDYVHWKDFGHTIGRTWEEVTAVWRRVYLERPALIERFGEELGNQIPLDTKPEDKDSADESYQALIYEIWDKATNTAIWISKSLNKILDARSDPLKLEGFFPCPRPLYATITTDNLVPEPDFTLYQDQARELDTLAARIERLIDALQIKGVYDSSVKELARLFKEAPNTGLIPVENWAAFAEKNGLQGAISLVDLAPIANALNAAYEATDRVKAQIYEITGMADIIRGSSDPRETATAVAAKGQFGSMRLRAMQSDVVQYATEILQIKAQIMCNEYQDQTWIEISAAMQLSPQDQQLIGPALQLIRSGVLRNFRIEVTSDSMIQMDEAQEKQDRMEFMKVAGGYLEGLIKMSHEAPKLVPLGVDMLKFAVTGFKVGKQLEGAIDQMADEMRDELKKQQENPQPPPEPPELQIEKMRMQADGQKFQATQQAEAQKMQAEQQHEMQKLQMAAQLDQQAAQGEMALEQQRMQMNAQLEQQKMQAARDKEMAQMQADQAVSQAQMQADMEVARNKMQLDAELERVKAQAKVDAELQSAQFNEQMAQLKLSYESDVKLQIAKIEAEAKILAAQISSQATPEATIGASDGAETSSALALALQGFGEALNAMRQPKQVIRDANGKIIGVS